MADSRTRDILGAAAGSPFGPVRSGAARISRFFPPNSRIARAGRSISSAAGAVADAPEAVIDYGLRAGRSIAQYALEDPDPDPSMYAAGDVGADYPLEGTAIGANSISAPPYQESAVPASVGSGAMGRAFPGDIHSELGQHPYSPEEGPLRSAETPAGSVPKPAMRAIRLPNGKMLFTNQDYGGDEVVGGPAAAGAEIRAQDRARSENPVGDTMRSLVRAATVTASQSDAPGALVDASRRQAAVRGETAAPFAAPTRRVIGPEFQDTPGGYSLIEGTPEQQDELAIEGGEREITKSGMAEELKRTQERAALPLQEAAALDNPRIQIANRIDSYGPQQDEIIREADAEKTAIMQGPLPPDQKAAAIERIDALRNGYLQNIRDRMSVIGGQALPQLYQ